MKRLTTLVSILISVSMISSVSASEDVVGKWLGKLVPAPGSEVTIHFIINQNDDGSYSAVLDSPDLGGIKNMEASSVIYDAGHLKMEVPELSGSYEGIKENGIIEGEWKQEGTSFPLTLKLSEERGLNKEEMDILVGQWHGIPELPQGAMGNMPVHVFRFEMTEEGEFKGSINLGGFGEGEPVTDMRMSDDNFMCKFMLNNEFRGELHEDEIVGAITFPRNPQPLPLNLKKGEYEAPVYSLNLPEETMNILSGDWHGELKLPGGTGMMIVSLRFERTENGEFVGYYAGRVPITEANLDNGKLTLIIQNSNAEFKAQIIDDELVGEWSMSGMPRTSVTLKRGRFEPPVIDLNLPEETQRLLTGRWEGETESLILQLRFEKTENGEFVGSIISQEQDRMLNMMIAEGDFTDGKLTLKVNLRDSEIEIKGDLSGDDFTGEYVEGENITPISLKKSGD